MAASTFQNISPLMSMSLAGSVERVPSADSSNGPTVASAAFVVKNTFLEVVDGDEVLCEVRPRRNKSAPAELRFAASSAPTFGQDYAPGGGKPRRSQSDNSVADLASTNKHGKSLEMTPKLEPLCRTKWSTTPDTTDAEDWGDSHTETCTTDSEDHDGSGLDPQDSALVPIALSDLLHDHLAKRPPKVQLSSKAKSWTPRGALSFGAKTLAPKAFCPSPSFPNDVKMQFMTVLAAAQMALGSCVFVQGIQLAQRAGGWSLKGIAQQSVLQNQAQLIFAAVQQAIIKAAANSNNVYVVGYERNPFVATHAWGFSFRLAQVPDESSACWDLITSGVCSGAFSCRRQHPAWQAAVDVSLAAFP